MQWHQVKLGTKVELLQHQYTLNVPFGRSCGDLFTHAELQDVLQRTFSKGDVLTLEQAGDDLICSIDGDELSIRVQPEGEVDPTVYKLLEK